MKASSSLHPVLRAGLVVSTMVGLAACASNPKPKPAATPATDPRNNLKAGLFDAAEYSSNLKVIAQAN